jgi:hypothetical protein
MYRISPLTYITAALAGVGLNGRQVICSSSEVTVFDTPADQTCGDYLTEYLKVAPGYLLNSDATANCQYCPLSSADQFLAEYGVFYEQRWRNSGIVWGFVAFNVSTSLSVSTKNIQLTVLLVDHDLPVILRLPCQSVEEGNIVFVGIGSRGVQECLDKRYG